ncbi:FAD-dependent oxidoreductase [Oceanispirochaeta crateris]|uniref:FAD-dependent oxidoreductase n=1 Tax=Oceanispirochaeta crateris TaxID=2518645 RepID=A0A5C1QQA9_9SPIO|nr:FAD-dependent oxidoreductase [Oceanispirochaeta crateris]QEN09697.1 FAD-dependent oxidoreductase [Oceanispirochaeta crateris]
MTFITTILEKQIIMDRTWLFTLDRGSFEFQPGQFINLSTGPGNDRREFSIASPSQQKTLEVLITRQKDGALSPLLCDSPVGAKWTVEGPEGQFQLSPLERKSPVLMIATGSGISPFGSLIRSYPGLDYQILHGLPHFGRIKEWINFPAKRYTLCTSRSGDGDFSGRVTERLKQISLSSKAIYMLCGNSDMIFDSMAILQDRGIPRKNIKAEIYF